MKNSQNALTTLYIFSMIDNMQGYIDRHITKKLHQLLEQFPVVAILGPRQCGKSTLAKSFTHSRPFIYIDLERPSDQHKLTEPELYFKQHRQDLLCLDEIQRLPNIFPLLRSEVDDDRENGRFLLLGSASPELLKQSAESLAGRIAYIELTPFLLSELQETSLASVLWLRGGFPNSFLSNSDANSFEWRHQFIRTFLEQDLPQLGIQTPAPLLRRFWQMCAHNHGQLLNRAKLAQAMGVSNNTIQHYLDILMQTFVMRSIPPYFANTKKRLIKSPKIYLRDTGILHTLLGIETQDDLFGHPIFGASWESFVIENIIGQLDSSWNFFFYRTAEGAELDLILEKGQKRYAIECKASVTPKVTKGFWTALTDLHITKAWIISPINDSYPLTKEVTVSGLAEFLKNF